MRWRDTVYLLIAIPWALGAYVIEAYNPKKIEDVGKIQDENPNLYAVVRSENPDKSLKIIGPINPTRQWRSIANEIDSKGEIYILENGNEVGLILEKELYVFGDKNKLSQVDFDKLIDRFIGMIRQKIPEQEIKIYTNIPELEKDIIALTKK